MAVRISILESPAGRLTWFRGHRDSLDILRPFEYLLFQSCGTSPPRRPPIPRSATAPDVARLSLASCLSAQRATAARHLPFNTGSSRTKSRSPRFCYGFLRSYLMRGIFIGGFVLWPKKFASGKSARVASVANCIVPSLLARFYERKSATGAATSVGKNFGA